MPLGALGELRPLLDTASSEKKPPRMVLGLRDVLDYSRIRSAMRGRTWERTTTWSDTTRFSSMDVRTSTTRRLRTT